MPKKKEQRTPTKAAIATALTKSFGNVSAAARSIGIERTSLYRRVQDDESLQEIVDQARQSMVDNAESALASAVLSGEAWAVCFALKTQGKARGYVERVQLQHGGEIKTEVQIYLPDNGRNPTPARPAGKVPTKPS